MRKAKPKKRQILPDPVFGDVKVTRFVNHLMYDGKKNTAFEIFYTALNAVKAKMPNEEKSALEIWKKALDNVTCIIVSHKKAALDICNKTIQIKNGKIISEG